MLWSEFSGRRVGILGAGREGLAVWRGLRARYPDQRLCLFSESPVTTEVAEAVAAKGDELRVGPLELTRLKAFDVLVRSPGVSPYRPELHALENVRLTSASNIWFAENPHARTICITGTKGKSTTTALTAHLLRAAGHNAVTAGNIGHPMLDLPVQGVEWWVIELSSYQLCDLQAGPTLGAILNLSAEHLDWHGGVEQYRADKLRLAGLLPAGALAADFRDTRLREALAAHPGVRWYNDAHGWHVDRGGVCRADEPGAGLSLPALPGRHNLANLAAALTLCEMAGALAEDLPAACDSFRGLPHRLHEIGTRDGRRYVDDSLSTTPVAVLAALEAFAGTDVTLLVGGLDRGIDWTGLMHQFEPYLPRAIIALPDNGPHVLECFRQAALEPPGGLHEAASLQAAVTLAERLTPRDGVVLLSPGAPSFPHFRDYRERGEVFARAAGIETKKETAGQG